MQHKFKQSEYKMQQSVEENQGWLHGVSRQGGQRFSSPHPQRSFAFLAPSRQDGQTSRSLYSRESVRFRELPAPSLFLP